MLAGWDRTPPGQPFEDAAPHRPEEDPVAYDWVKQLAGWLLGWTVVTMACEDTDDGGRRIVLHCRKDG